MTAIKSDKMFVYLVCMAFYCLTGPELPSQKSTESTVVKQVKISRINLSRSMEDRIIFEEEKQMEALMHLRI